ncbi:ArnT family glycosyltransferase [Chloroflexota bacterium]
MIAIYIGVVAGIVYAAFSNWGYDDPFITYRYAQNFARGAGFVYNPGERIQSTTTPLFTLILAAIYPLWPDIPHTAILVGALSLPLGALFLWDLAHSWGTPLAGWLSLVLYPTFPLLLTTLGSETPLYLAFCLGAFAFYGRDKLELSAVFAALAILTRPDGALVPIILSADYLWRVRHPIPWKPILIFLGCTLPWFIFAWVYFGSPIPVTLTVKQIQGSMTISQRFAPGFLTILRPYSTVWYYWLEAALALLGIWFMIRFARRWLVLLSWTLLYFFAFSALGVSRYFWYYAPLVPGFVVLIGLGVTAIDNLKKLKLGQNQSEPSWINHSTYILTFVLIAVLTLGRINNLSQLWGISDARSVIYRTVGEWLRENTPDKVEVGMLEVGIIGYYSERPIIGFAGLIRPEVASQLTPKNDYRDAAYWVIKNNKPEYLVLHSGFFPPDKQIFVEQHCQVAQQFVGETYGYGGDLQIYQCAYQ